MAAFDTTAERVRRRVRGSVERFWSADDFADVPHGAVLRALSRLAQDGELRHVRRSLYWRGRQTLLGMSPPSTQQLLSAVVGKDGVGPASISAALALGLSTQHPRRDIVAVPGRAPRSLPDRIDVRTRQGREGRVAARLNWWEVALLEVLADWSSVIEVPREEAIRELGNWLRSDRVRVDRLAQAARDESALVRVGLRGLLVSAGFDAQAQRIPRAHTREVRDRALVAA